MNKNKRLLQIIVPILILVVIGGIYLLKAKEREDLHTADPSLAIPLMATTIDIEELAKHGLPMMLDFGADYCPPCREMAPTLKKLNEEMQEKALIQYVDIEKFEEPINLPIQVIPTQFFYNADGTPYVPGDDLGIEFTLYNAKDTDKHTLTVHEGLLTEEQIRTILKDMGAKE